MNSLNFASKAMTIKIDPIKHIQTVKKKNDPMQTEYETTPKIKKGGNDKMNTSSYSYNNASYNNNSFMGGSRSPYANKSNVGNVREAFNSARRGRSVGPTGRSNDEEVFNKANFKNINDKFYSMITFLQNELGQLIIDNYALEEENKELEMQIRKYKP